MKKRKALINNKRCIVAVIVDKYLHRIKCKYQVTERYRPKESRFRIGGKKIVNESKKNNKY